MIDLAKPLGVHNELVFYGDHEFPDIVYYFPDEVRLARQSGSTTELDAYELLFQIFHEGGVNEGGVGELRKTAGSILQLGVQCSVSDDRLEKAVDSLKRVHPLPDDLRIATPHWSDGTVNLIALDATTQDVTTMGEDSFVKSVIGSQKPSLSSANLKSVFNVRFDRRGTALISSALDGTGGSVAGILYDLRYAAIRPAVDLRIWADLGRCYDSVSHELGVNVEFQYYVKFSIGAEFEWLTKKLEENGDLKVELLSQVEDAETKKLVDEMVKEFKESILKELFRPYVNPAVPDITNMTGMVPEIGVSYAFRTERIEHGKIIEVDYRERSVTVRTHNPQSHLWVFGRQIADNRSTYVKKVVFSELWREQELQVSLINDFTRAQNDLLSAEVLIWRKKAGIAEDVQPGRFSIPDNTDPIKHITFHKELTGPVTFSWLYDEDEAVGYFYQIRFLFSNTLKNISSPREIVTEPVSGSTQNLILFPETFVFYKHIEIRCGNLSFDEFSGVDVVLHLKNRVGEILDVEIITLNAGNTEETWIIRGPDKRKLYVEASKEYHFKDNSPSIKTEPIYLVDDEIVVNRPLNKSQFELMPVVAGTASHVREILLKVILHSPSFEDPIVRVHRIAGPGFNSGPLEIRFNTADDTLMYEAVALTDEGKLVNMGSGQITENVVVLDLNKVTVRNVEFRWKGPSPVAADLKYLRVELRSVDETGNLEVLDPIEFKGDILPEKVIKSFDRSLTIEMRKVKRFIDGTIDKGEYSLINGEDVLIEI